ncbi:DinB family protein [Nonomuraea aridisoli]|uniref:DinB family protein n=1 Tax=Nonomuraea aridisoli TaxID=2070368 RepID=UPI001F4103EF|nr:DinB family protein [Nonomuraea aridisoli]
MTWTAPHVVRADEPFVAGERAMLEGFLDWQRGTLLHKCAGLTAAQLAERPLAPSNLSLLGLVRHLTDVERTWFRRRFAAQAVPSLYGTPDRPDAAFDDADPARAAYDLAALVAEQAAAREAASGLPLDAIFDSPRWGPMCLRWAIVHMHGEYARHNGHADLLRERVDGTVGT